MEGATPPFSALVRHRGGVCGPPFGPPLTPPGGGRSLHIDPCGKAPMKTTEETTEFPFVAGWNAQKLGVCAAEKRQGKSTYMGQKAANFEAHLRERSSFWLFLDARLNP